MSKDKKHIPLPADIRACDQRGETWLHDLVYDDNATAEDIKRGIAAGADLYAQNDDGIPPVGLAILKGREDLVQGYIDSGMDLCFDIRNGKTFNAIYLALMHTQFKCLQVLLRSDKAALGLNAPGINKDERQEGLHPLHLAARDNRTEWISLLIAKGALVDGLSSQEDAPVTALHLAIYHRKYKTIRALINAGADIELPTKKDGYRALHTAILEKTADTALELIDFGADIHARTKNQETPLFLACQGDHSEKNRIVRKLIAAGADVNARDKSGQTPLMQAARDSNTDAIRMLLNAGADPLLTDTFNNSARDLVARGYSDYNRYHTAETLLEKAAEEAYRRQCNEGYRQQKNKKNSSPNKRPPKP